MISYCFVCYLWPFFCWTYVRLRKQNISIISQFWKMPRDFARFRRPNQQGNDWMPKTIGIKLSKFVFSIVPADDARTSVGTSTEEKDKISYTSYISRYMILVLFCKHGGYKRIEKHHVPKHPKTPQRTNLVNNAWDMLCTRDRHLK